MLLFVKFNMQKNNWKCGSWNFDAGHINVMRATYFCQSLAPIGHQLWKLNNTPDVIKIMCEIVARHVGGGRSCNVMVLIMGN